LEEARVHLGKALITASKLPWSPVLKSLWIKLTKILNTSRHSIDHMGGG
jgi:hypothetical protein